MSRTVRARVIKASVSPTTNQIHKDEFANTYRDIIEPPYNLKELKLIAEYSSILQQCVNAYKTNIVEFGVEAEYKIDVNSEDIADEIKANAEIEHTRLSEFIRYINLDDSPEVILGYAIDDKEKKDNGYLEVIRDGLNIPAGIEYVDTQYMRVCKRTAPEEVEYTILENGVEKKVKRRKQFRRHVQLIDEKKVFFKEYGDLRIMDLSTGEFNVNAPNNLRATRYFRLGRGWKRR